MNGFDIKRLREERGITQAELAKATGIKHGSLGRLESTGGDVVKVNEYNALMEYFNKNEPKPLLEESEVLNIPKDTTNIDEKIAKYLELTAKAEKLLMEILLEKKL